MLIKKNIESIELLNLVNDIKIVSVCGQTMRVLTTIWEPFSVNCPKLIRRKSILRQPSLSTRSIPAHTSIWPIYTGMIWIVCSALDFLFSIEMKTKAINNIE